MSSLEEPEFIRLGKNIKLQCTILTCLMHLRKVSANAGKILKTSNGTFGRGI